MTKFFHEDGSRPAPGEVFVFGSNTAGRHGAGAAKEAKLHYGAVYGQGRGPMGMSYAIPTKTDDLKAPLRNGKHELKVLPIESIEKSIEDFLLYARLHLETEFFVTRIGCGLAGFDDDQIGPLFAEAPDNCNLPNDWKIYVMQQREAFPVSRD